MVDEGSGHPGRRTATEKRRGVVQAAFFFGTLAPFRRASDKPIAIACLRLLTRLPLLPLVNVPFFRLCIVRLTDFWALLP